MWHHGRGVVVYDPLRGTMKRRTQWWCVINTDPEIARYYRYWVNKEILNPLGLPKRDLALPAWGAHISVIRGEKPRPGHEHLWGKYNGQQVEFRYQHHVRQSGDTTGGDRPDWYWFVDVECDLATHMREEFGFPTKWRYHLTIGRTYEGDERGKTKLAA